MTTAHRRLIITAALLLVLGACTQVTLVEAKRQKIGDAFSVEPRAAWNRISAPGIEVWTLDGDALEAVRFFKGVKDKQTLFPGDSAEKMPTFAAGMTPNDVMELVLDTLSRAGASQVEARNLRPADFGSAAGFRFELSYLDAHGLEVDGMAGGAVIDGALHMILYTGARAHYFPKYRERVEDLMLSVETS